MKLLFDYLNVSQSIHQLTDGRTGKQTDAWTDRQHTNTALCTYILHSVKVLYCNTQFTPPTPTRLNCRVELRRRCAHTSRLSWPSLQFCSLYVTGAENCKLGHDWRLVRSHRRHDATRLRYRQIVQTRRDCRQLVANSIHTADATQLDIWVAVCIGLKFHGIMLTTFA